MQTTLAATNGYEIGGTLIFYALLAVVVGGGLVLVVKLLQKVFSRKAD